MPEFESYNQRFHIDHCEHPCDSYVGSASYYDERGKLDHIDVYVYNDCYHHQQHVCIRYSNEGHEYYSPGSLVNFIKYAEHLKVYRVALALILEKGKILFQRN